MRKKGRRGKGKGNKRGGAKQAGPEGADDVDMTSSPGAGAELEDGVKDNDARLTSAGAADDGRGITTISTALPPGLDCANNNSNSSGMEEDAVDGNLLGAGDGAGGDESGENSNSSIMEDTEPLHHGFMHTGPNRYRAGSTAVNLNNCQANDIEPEFMKNDICLSVECGGNTGVMYMSKLYQGSKGKCIEVSPVY